MKPQHLKLAGIVTMMCGGMSPMCASATGSDAPHLVTGRIVPIQGAPPAIMMVTADGVGQDTAPAAMDGAQEFARTQPQTVPAVQDAAVDVVGTGVVVYAAGTAIPSYGALAPVEGAVPDPALAKNGPTAPDENSLPGAVTEANTTVSLAGNHASPRASLPSNGGHAADVSDRLATGGKPLQRAALKLGDAVDVVATSGHRLQPADTVRRASGAVLEGTAAIPGAVQKADEDPAWASADVVAVNDNRLDSTRGGFDLPSGLVVSFGISRAAFVNGTLVSSTSFNIPNITQMTPQQAQMLANANAGALVQNGLNNTVQPGALPALSGSVIQNTLSNQQIQVLTTINTSVNSLAAFRSLNLGQTLNSALLNAVRPR